MPWLSVATESIEPSGEAEPRRAWPSRLHQTLVLARVHTVFFGDFNFTSLLHQHCCEIGNAVSFQPCSQAHILEKHWQGHIRLRKEAASHVHAGNQLHHAGRTFLAYAMACKQQ